MTLADYGLIVTGTPHIMDNITFERLKYLTPQSNLMPELYYKTDGERRFYNAVNYPHEGISADTAAGETFDSGTGMVNNDLYKDENNNYYDFQNPYEGRNVSELINNYEDIKPSIKGMTNTVNNNTFRIDVAAAYAFDEMDDDTVWENEEDGNIQGDYKHPHFFIKLRQLPFNIFDMALTSDMEINMTSGSCGACKFKIKVDEKTKKNPVQVWEYDVYKKKPIVSPTDYDPYIKVASAGDLKRYTDLELYKRGTRHTYETTIGGVPVSVIYYDYIQVDTDFGAMYTAEAISNGLVGSLNTENYSHIEGDVVTRGQFQSQQQDTSAGEVWIALEKDTDTFGMLMPAARPTYSDVTYSIYVRPQSVADTGSEDTADTFVITNIRMPQYYLRYAEHKLSEAIIADLDKENKQKFNFNVGFSRIFLAQTPLFLNNLTENAVLYVGYNHKKYKQYIKSYTYKMNSTEALPEITVEVNEDLSVVYGGFTGRVSRQVTRRVSGVVSNQVVTRVTDDIRRRYIGRNSDVVVSGNIVSLAKSESLVESGMQSEYSEGKTRELTSNGNFEIEYAGKYRNDNDTEVAKKANSADVYSKTVVDSTFATVAKVTNDFSVIRQTMEHRFAGEGKTDCDKDYVYSTTDGRKMFWITADGVENDMDENVCSVSVWQYGTNKND